MLLSDATLCVFCFKSLSVHEDKFCDRCDELIGGNVLLHDEPEILAAKREADSFYPSPWEGR
jgi:hypothetical protein